MSDQFIWFVSILGVIVVSLIVVSVISRQEVKPLELLDAPEWPEEDYPLPDLTPDPIDVRRAEREAKLAEALSTPARYQVIRVLLDADAPMTVREIFAQTKGLQHIGIAKVLRALSGAYGVGLVSIHTHRRDPDTFVVKEPRRSQLEALLADNEVA